jgi:pyruvate/2-oxoglutarate dehydrogenase complex dihydrolipoamide acyltransferase (E2) component
MAGGFRRQREPSAWRKVALHTWGRRSDPTVYGVLELDATSALAYVEALRASSGAHVTVTHLVGKAIALAIAERPEVNAVIRRGRQIHLRDAIDVFFQVSMDGGEDLAGAKVARADEKGVADEAMRASSSPHPWVT